MKQNPKPELIHAFLLDPFKGCVISIQLNPADPGLDRRWHSLLDCEYIEHVRCDFGPELPEHALWVDESGLLREPDPYPQFKLAGANGGAPIAGYGILSGVRGPEVSSVEIPALILSQLIQFEQWQHRLKPEQYLPQLLRLYLPWP